MSPFVFLGESRKVAFASHVDVVHNQPSSWGANQSGNIVIRGCKNIQIFRNSLGSQAIAAIYIETSLVFPNEGVFTIQSNRVVGEVGHGFSITGSSGVEAEISVRGNYFTENSGTDIEIPAVKLCGHFLRFVFFRIDRCLGKSFLVKLAVLCLHFKTLSLSSKRLGN